MRNPPLAIVTGLLTVFSAVAQSPVTFKTRLAPVAIDAAMKTNIAGSGSATATLVGSKLTINGTFEGLKSNATMAHIHQGSAAGVRGAKLLDLTVTKAMNGTLSGSFDLTPEQTDNLKKGKWYIQIHSEKAPDGNLWGWLMQ
jgi:CHRD domain